MSRTLPLFIKPSMTPIEKKRRRWTIEVDLNHRWEFNEITMITKRVEEGIKSRKVTKNHRLHRQVSISGQYRRVRLAISKEKEDLLQRLSHKNWKQSITSARTRQWTVIIQQVTSFHLLANILFQVLSTSLLNRNTPAHSFGKSSSKERYQYLMKSDDELGPGYYQHFSEFGQTKRWLDLVLYLLINHQSTKIIAFPFLHCSHHFVVCALIIPINRMLELKIENPDAFQFASTVTKDSKSRDEGMQLG